MLDFHQKRKVRGIMYHKVTLGFLAVLTLLSLHSTWSVFKKEKESENLMNISLEHVKELRKRNEDLQSKIDKLATVTGIEEEIRTKFSVAKDNEKLVVVVPVDSSKASTTIPKTNLWQKIKNFFK